MSEPENMPIGQLLINSFGDSYLYEVNRGTFNQSGAQLFFQSHYRDELFDENTFYLIVGTDSGLLVNFVKENGLPKGSRYLFIELRSVLEKININCQSDDLPHGLSICTFDEWQDSANELCIVNYISLEKTRLMRSIGALDAYLFQYRQLSEDLEQAYYQLCWKESVNFSGHLFIDEQLKNIPENYFPASCLKNVAKGKTAILLAGGPSLDDIIPQLKNLEDNVLIVAVSRISRRLLEMDIKPDVIVSIDPTDKMFAVSKEMFDIQENTLFINAYHVTSKLLSAWQGNHIYLGNRFPWSSHLNYDNISVVGPTVTNAAIAILIEMGCSEVLLAGVDLSYSAEGFSHARGSQEYISGPRIGFNGQKVKLYNGQVGETEPAFYAAIKTIGKQAELAQIQGCKIINLSPNAAKMENIPYKPLSEIKIKSMNRSIQSIIAEQLASFSFDDDFKLCVEELNTTHRRLKRIVELVDQALHYNQQISNRNYQQSIAVAKIDTIEKKLQQQYQDLLIVIKFHSYKDFLGVYQPKKGLEWTENELQQATSAYFTGYKRGAIKLQRSIMQALKRLYCRLEEKRIKPNFEIMLNQWQHDMQFGRAHLWKNKNSDKFESLSNEIKQRVEFCQQCFNKQLEIKPEVKRLNLKNIEQYKNVQIKLYTLYTHREKNYLSKIKDMLCKYEGEEGKDLLLLAEAYLADLQENYTLAIEKYYAASKGDLQEIALNHLSSILLKIHDGENALTALECLSYITPGYMPQYAKLCQLLGDKAKAIDIYKQYLTIVPNDYAVMIKLGCLYKEMDEKLQASHIFEKIIQQSPNNSMAKKHLNELADV